MKYLLEAELNPGERLIWSQQPRPLPLVLKTWPTFSFGIPFFSLPAFVLGRLVFPQWHQAESKSIALLLLVLSFLGLFAAIGLGLILSPLLAWWKAKRTIYAITDQRCIIISAPWRREIHSYIAGQGLGEIENLHRIENARGQGDIIFHQQALPGRHNKVYFANVGFIGIDRAREVEGKVRELMKNAHATNPS